MFASRVATAAATLRQNQDDPSALLEPSAKGV